MQKNDKLFSIVIFAVFTLLSLCLFIFHEPWRDEIQSWLLVRDLSLPALIAQLRYDGHPITWFLMLFPFAKLGFPFLAERIIHLFLVIGCAYIICFRTRLHKYFKLLILFASPLAYELNALSRNYVISVFLLLILAVNFEDRFTKKNIVYSLTLFFLINTNIYAAVIGIALYGSDFLVALIYRIKEKQPFEKGLIFLSVCFSAGILILFAVLFTDVMQGFNLIKPYENAHFYQIQSFSLDGGRLLSGLQKVISLTFFNHFALTDSLRDGGRRLSDLQKVIPFTFFNRFTLSDTLRTAVIVCVGTPLILAIILKIASLADYGKKKMFIVFCGGAAFMGTVLAASITNIFKLRHDTPFIFTFVFLLIIACGTAKEMPENDSKTKPANGYKFAFLIFILFSASCIFTLKSIKEDIFMDYSHVKKTAAFIRQSGYDNGQTLVLSNDEPQTSPIIALLNEVKTFRYVTGDRSFVYWQEYNSDYENSLDLSLFIERQLEDSSYENIIFVSRNVENEALIRFPIIFESGVDSITVDERYFIYKLK